MFALASIFFIFTSIINAAAAASQAGTIVEPAPGTAIAPGARFNFTYNVMADYSVSSFWYHVWLLDPLHAGAAKSSSSSITTDSLASAFNSGFYFGRYDFPNYPGE